MLIKKWKLLFKITTRKWPWIKTIYVNFRLYVRFLKLFTKKFHIALSPIAKLNFSIFTDIQAEF